MAVVSPCCERSRTGKILNQNCFLGKITTIKFFGLRAKSGLYDPNVLGYICATIIIYKEGERNL